MPRTSAGQGTEGRRGLGGVAVVARRDRQRGGEAEVEDLHAAVGGDEDVVGLQVAVHDAAGVRGAEPGGDLEPVADHVALGKRAAFEPDPQRLAVEQLGDQVGHVAGADVEDREQVGVRQRGDGARLLLEAGQPGRVLRWRPAAAPSRRRRARGAGRGRDRPRPSRRRRSSRGCRTAPAGYRPWRSSPLSASEGSSTIAAQRVATSGAMSPRRFVARMARPSHAAIRCSSLPTSRLA